jgi:hypothetical protein
VLAGSRSGRRTLLEWYTSHVVFPRVKGSPCSESIISVYGLDSAIRGERRRGRRPDFALIDDPETQESARSLLQINERETKIDRDIGDRRAGRAGSARYSRYPDDDPKPLLPLCAADGPKAQALLSRQTLFANRPVAAGKGTVGRVYASTPDGI